MAQKTIKAKRARKGRTLNVKGLAAKVEAAASSRTDLPEFRAGDTLRVHVRIKEGEKERIQAFEGVCILRQNRGAGKAFNVRKVSHGMGVERVFLEASPKVAKVEVLESGRVRRAKLYYLRELEGKAAKVERETKGAESSSAPAPTQQA